MVKFQVNFNFTWKCRSIEALESGNDKKEARGRRSKIC